MVTLCAYNRYLKKKVVRPVTPCRTVAAEHTSVKAHAVQTVAGGADYSGFKIIAANDQPSVVPFEKLTPPL